VYRCLRNVCGSAAVNRSTAGQWTKRVTASETGKAELHDLPCSGCPVTAVSPEMLQHAGAIICEN
jgi:aminoglycoside phosphotransferase